MIRRRRRDQVTDLGRLETTWTNDVVSATHLSRHYTHQNPVVSPMNGRMRFIIVAAILVCLVGCDQVSKNYAVDNWQHTHRNPMFFLGNTFLIQYDVNPGAFL